MQGTGHVRERHDTVRQLLVPSYACRKIEAAFQRDQECLLVGGLFQSWLLLFKWQPIFLASTSTSAVWRWMLVLQASPVTTSTQALLAHRFVSKQPWEWKQKLRSGFILLKAASYNKQSGAIHLIECKVSEDNSPFTFRSFRRQQFVNPPLLGRQVKMLQKSVFHPLLVCQNMTKNPTSRTLCMVWIKRLPLLTPGWIKSWSQLVLPFFPQLPRPLGKELYIYFLLGWQVWCCPKGP